MRRFSFLFVVEPRRKIPLNKMLEFQGIFPISFDQSRPHFPRKPGLSKIVVVYIDSDP
jgi:hypothetical protein